MCSKETALVPSSSWHRSLTKGPTRRACEGADVILFAYGSGWLAAALLASTIGLAGLRSLLHRWRQPVATGWLRAHNWLGAAATTLGVGHGLGSITRAQLPAGAEVGLWAASFAMGLLVWEAVLGLTLSAAGPPQRRRLRRRHLAMMLVVVALVALHVALDGPLPR